MTVSRFSTFFLAATACGGDDAIPADGGTSDGAPDGGGGAVTITSSDGTLTLVVPAGALPAGVVASDLRVTIDDTPDVRRLSVTAEQAMAGEFTAADEVPPLRAYQLEPAGTVFAFPALATVRVDGAMLGNGASVTLASAERVESARIIDVRAPDGGGTVELDVEVPHFSELDLWPDRTDAENALRLTNTTPAAGAEIVVGTSFTNVFDLELLVGSDVVYRSDVYDDLADPPTLLASWLNIEHVRSDPWDLYGILYFGGTVTPVRLDGARQDVTGTTASLSRGPATCMVRRDGRSPPLCLGQLPRGCHAHGAGWGDTHVSRNVQHQLSTAHRSRGHHRVRRRSGNGLPRPRRTHTRRPDPRADDVRRDPERGRRLRRLSAGHPLHGRSRLRCRLRLRLRLLPPTRAAAPGHARDLDERHAGRGHRLERRGHARRAHARRTRHQ